MSYVLHAPNRAAAVPGVPTVFLAGSIEMGKAEPWQDRLADDLKDQKVILFNPRRPDWDSSWVQDPTKGTQFRTQVEWELDHIEAADHVVFYFDPKTQSPITLLEMGTCVGKKDMVVCCSKDFFRYGNVAIVCERHGVPLVETYEELLEALKKKI